MNEWTSTPGAVAGAYVGAVRDELADLPDEVRIDLMEDVVEHVTAVAAEYTDLTMDALVDRLGAPSEYAAQLREAAGLVSMPAPAESSRDGYARRLGRFLTVMFCFGALAMVSLSLLVLDTGLLWAAGILAVAAAGVLALLVRDGRRIRDEVERMPGASLLRRGRVWFTEQTWSSEAVELALSLRPGWWILRGVAVAVALGMATVSIPVIVVSVVPLVALSVWLGRRTVQQRPRGVAHAAAVAANGALALTTVGAGIGIFEQATQPPIYVANDPYQEVYVETDPLEHSGVFRDGRQVTNLFAYGPDGQLLEGVRLYDQDGRPFDLGLADNCQEWGEPGWMYLPHGDPVNSFPHRLIEVDPVTGECLDPVTVPPFGPFLPGAPATENTTPDATSGEK